VHLLVSEHYIDSIMHGATKKLPTANIELEMKCVEGMTILKVSLLVYDKMA